jgi:prepilin-type N-terminal cleavage/methylation domain-containing protein
MMPRRNGFTLIELLIVLLLVAILATMGLNRFWAAKDRSLISTMTADLRSLATEQEIYFDRNLAYAGNLADLVDYAPSPGVTITLTIAQTDGWAGNAVHASLAGKQCGLFTGNAPQASGAPATVVGVIACN